MRQRTTWRRVVTVVAVSLSLLPCARVGAQTAGGAPSGRQTVTLSLEQSLRMALSRSPTVRQAEAEVEGLRGKQLQALGAGYPQVELTTVLGPSPRARGNQVSSPDDQYSPDITGVFVRGGLEIIQPLFTWGLITNARLAAEHGVRATQAGVDVRTREVALRVKEAYWGVVVARTLREFLLEIRELVDQAAERTQRLLESGFTTEIDVYRLLTGKAELEKNLALVDKTLDLARTALATWTGQPPGTLVEPADRALPADLKDLPALERFIEDARARRPEFAQLRDGLSARQALVEVERAKRYPLVFAGIFGSAAYATNRDRLDNPFVQDPLRHLAIGPVIGFRYNLDFGIATGRIKEAEAEVQKLEALRDFAQEEIPLQVRQAHGVVVEAKRNAQAFEEAHTHAKKMLVAASSNYDFGLGEPRDLADAVAAYAKSRGEDLQALYAYVFGLERLAHVAGLDLEEVRRLSAPPGRTQAGASRAWP